MIRLTFSPIVLDRLRPLLSLLIELKSQHRTFQADKKAAENLAKGEADEFESGSQNNFNDDFNDDDGWIGKSKYANFFRRHVINHNDAKHYDTWEYQRSA